MSKLRAAVIGVGYLGHFHAQKYALLEEAELAGVVDADPERARTIATALHTRPYTDYRELLGSIDVASIVVPTEHHHRVAQDCLEAGVHILLEKPVTETRTQAEELIALAERKRLVFQVGHLERFNPAVVEVQRLLDRPVFFESHRLSVFKPRGTDVNVVLDLMIHDIDIILSLVQQEIRELRASGYPVLTDEVDIANARLEFANGCVANVTASRVSQKAMRKMRIFQHDAYFSVDFPTSSIDIARRNGAERDEQGFPRISVEERKTAEKSDAILAEIQAFLDCVRTGATPPVTGRDGLQALAVALDISRAIGTPRRIGG
ncbi:MAG TPA: Gfo/Idh/MocA family oxidoreductase [Burkholderiales bacterium]|nr:Gfo/Idh/MocA family oxidoreductase [Betaproteobacteria bacterium]HQR51662.1 Gfo/Idh/MocA family oxidoreductase [Burkholderiales bacterium]